MMKDEALVVSSFFLCGEMGGCFPKEVGLEDRSPSGACSPQKFSKNFFGSGYGVVLNGWGELGIRGTERSEVGDLWSVRFLATIHL